MYEFFGSDYRYIVVSDNNNKPLTMTSEFKGNKSHKMHKTNITNNIINSTKLTAYKYGEEDQLISCLKDNEFYYDGIIISPREYENDCSNNINNENIIIENEKHAEVGN